MQIRTFFGVEEADQATGFVVIIDVFRAATTAAAALAHGAKEIVPVSTKEEAFLYKEGHANTCIMGEDHGEMISGFDFGNSPYRIAAAPIDGKTIVHRSTQGTQGLVKARHAETLVFGGFVTASAICSYIQQKNPETVSFVALAGKGTEDAFFADYMTARIRGEHPSMQSIVEKLRNAFGTEWFFDATKTEFPEEDFVFCLDLDKYSFVVEAISVPYLHLVKRDV